MFLSGCSIFFVVLHVAEEFAYVSLLSSRFEIRQFHDLEGYACYCLWGRILLSLFTSSGFKMHQFYHPRAMHVIVCGHGGETAGTIDRFLMVQLFSFRGAAVVRWIEDLGVLGRTIFLLTTSFSFWFSCLTFA